MGVPGSYTLWEDSHVSPVIIMLGKQSEVDRCIGRVGLR